MFSRIFVLALVLVGICGPCLAVQPGEVLKDKALESRARALSAELRCLVCQNQSIDDSDAPLARDLRVLVRERLKAGDSDEQVMDFVVARYGEFVLLRPRVGWHTAFLWGMPIGALFIASLGIFMAYRSRSAAEFRHKNEKALELSKDEQDRLKKILDEADG